LSLRRRSSNNSTFLPQRLAIYICASCTSH